MSSRTREPEYVSLADAAERLGVSVDTIRRRISAGKLRAYRLGPRLLRIRTVDLQEILTPIRH